MQVRVKSFFGIGVNGRRIASSWSPSWALTISQRSSNESVLLRQTLSKWNFRFVEAPSDTIINTLLICLNKIKIPAALNLPPIRNRKLLILHFLSLWHMLEIIILQLANHSSHSFVDCSAYFSLLLQKLPIKFTIKICNWPIFFMLPLSKLEYLSWNKIRDFPTWRNFLLLFDMGDHDLWMVWWCLNSEPINHLLPGTCYRFI